MIRLLHVTDSHLTGGAPPRTPPRAFADAVHALTNRSTDAATAMVLDHICRTFAIDLIVHTGDLVDAPTADAYDAGRKLFTGAGIPVVATPGNHDDPELLARAFGAASSSACHSVDIGSWRVVLASSAQEGEQAGTFASTLDHLDDVLGGDRPVLIATHHPPLSPCPDPDCNVTDAARFFDVVDAHANVAAVITGHLHLPGDLERRGVRYLLGPSTCLQLVHHHPLPARDQEPTPIGARVIDLHDDGTLHSQVVWAPTAETG